MCAMASSTRISRTPRRRIWASTICARCAISNGVFNGIMRSVPGAVECPGSRLFLALADLHVEADHAVLIAQRNHRDVSRDVVLRLDNLLRCLRNVSAVSKRQVVCYLLLDGHLRAA